MKRLRIAIARACMWLVWFVAPTDSDDGARVSLFAFRYFDEQAVPINVHRLARLMVDAGYDRETAIAFAAAEDARQGAHPL